MDFGYSGKRDRYNLNFLLDDFKSCITKSPCGHFQMLLHFLKNETRNVNIV